MREDGSQNSQIQKVWRRKIDAAAEDVSANICCRWFLNCTPREDTPHFSAVSDSFRHRFTEGTVDQVFAWILSEVAEADYLSPKAVFIDGTHITARRTVTGTGNTGAILNMRQLSGQSAVYPVKTVQRHIWKDYEEVADDAGYTSEYRELYKRCKEIIERAFADAREKHAMRYMQYRGLAQVTSWVKPNLAAMNLKKLAVWKRNGLSCLLLSRFLYPEYAKNPAAA